MERSFKTEVQSLSLSEGEIFRGDGDIEIETDQRFGVGIHALAADHRVTDGHLGGLYLAELDRLLQEPETL